MGRQRIGEVCTGDIWAFVFRCVGRVLFPVLLLMPFIVVWRVFFYVPEDFWPFVRSGFVYVIAVTMWVWLTSYKTVLECDSEKLCIIKKQCFFMGIAKKKISFDEIKQITFAEVKTAKREPSKFEKVFRLKLVYSLIYGLGRLLLNKGRMSVCITYGKEAQTIVIDDIKKNDARYLYLREFQRRFRSGE